MRRLARLAFHSAALVSAVLCAATILLWTRSASRNEIVGRSVLARLPSDPVEQKISSGPAVITGNSGLCLVLRADFRPRPTGATTHARWEWRTQPTPRPYYPRLPEAVQAGRGQTGFDWTHGWFQARSVTTTVSGARLHWTTLTAPGFVWAALTGILPALWLGSALSRLERRRRLRRNLCLRCAEDLSQTPAGPCPRCGAKRDDKTASWAT